jgi:hypothetical protein
MKYAQSVGWRLCWAAWATAAGAFPTEHPPAGTVAGGHEPGEWSGDGRLSTLSTCRKAAPRLAGATNAVTVVDGLYAADLESGAGRLGRGPDERGDLHLETEIDGTPLAPRERLGAAAYARLAASVTERRHRRTPAGERGGDGKQAGHGRRDRKEARDGRRDGGKNRHGRRDDGAKLGGERGELGQDPRRQHHGGRRGGQHVLAHGRQRGDACGFVHRHDGRHVVRDPVRERSGDPGGLESVAGSRHDHPDGAFQYGGLSRRAGCWPAGTRNAIEGNNYNVTLSGGTLNTVRVRGPEFRAGRRLPESDRHQRVSTATLSGGAHNDDRRVPPKARSFAGGQGEHRRRRPTPRSAAARATRCPAPVYAVAAGGKSATRRPGRWMRRSAAAPGTSRPTRRPGASSAAARTISFPGAASRSIGGRRQQPRHGESTRRWAAATATSPRKSSRRMAGGINNQATTEASTVGGGANNYAGGGEWAGPRSGGGYWQHGRRDRTPSVAGGYRQRARRRTGIRRRRRRQPDGRRRRSYGT